MKPISIEIRKLIVQQRNLGEMLMFPISVIAVSSIFRYKDQLVNNAMVVVHTSDCICL